MSDLSNTHSRGLCSGVSIEQLAAATPETAPRYLGIDPGVTGALVALDGDTAQFFDAPVIGLVTKTRSGGKRTTKEFDIAAMRDFLIIARGQGRCVAIIEEVHGWAGFDLHSVNSLVRGAGLWEGVCAGLGIPVRRVTPKSWKKHAQLLGSDKGASRLKAAQQFPLADLGPKSKTGRADALLIAAYGRAMAY